MKAKALDLFCGAGGATRGLQNAGFHVTGVDIVESPRYVGDYFVRDDVTSFPRGWHVGFDFIWASPPCQAHTAMRVVHNAKPHADLIPQTRIMLRAAGKPYAIENVEGAPLLNPITLCGCMFGLGAQGCRLQRRRLFECSFPIEAPPCTCTNDHRPVIGVYGGHARRRAASAGGRGTKDVWVGGHKAAASEAMGIDWMSLGELSEAIPPAYSEYIAREWLRCR